MKEAPRVLAQHTRHAENSPLRNTLFSILKTQFFHTSPGRAPATPRSTWPATHPSETARTRQSNAVVNALLTACFHPVIGHIIAHAVTRDRHSSPHTLHP